MERDRRREIEQSAECTVARQEELGASDANGSKEAQALAFGILFTPNAIVLTRDGHPVCEFPIK
jgi:hypothetical protein